MLAEAMDLVHDQAMQGEIGGELTRAQVAGAAGGQEFAYSVVAAASRWRVEKKDDATLGCRMAGESFLIVTFVY